MRKARLFSALFAAVLLFSLAVGMMFTTASASDTHIPAPTEIFAVGTDGDSIRACLEKAAGTTWSANSVLEIRFKGTDSSAYAKADSAQGVSGWTLFDIPTIFREDDTKLPIVIRGMDADRAATIYTEENTYCATNDYFFTNLTMGGGTTGKFVVIYAGSGELVFENTHHKNYLWTKYFGDNPVMDAYLGWDAAKVAANSNEKGLVETGIVFGTGCTGLFQKMSSKATDPNYTSDDGQHMAAVGFDASAEIGAPILASFKRAASSVTSALTDEEVAAVREEAVTSTFSPGNIISSHCIVKPCNTAAYLVVDLGTVATSADTVPDFGYCCARRGTSPVAEARLEIISGGIQYVSAGAATSKTNETYVGDTTVIMRGGRSGCSTSGGYSDVGIRLSNHAMFVGNLTLKIHEDDPNFPTWTPWIQCSQGGETSTVFGNFYFLMTGGTIGEGTASSVNDGYWGAPLATGTVVNEVRGGKIWSFSGSRYTNLNENTPVSTVLPGTGETLAVKVSIHNKISGGEFGGEIDGAILSGRGFYGQCRTNGNYILGSVCNEITGGTFYSFGGANNTTTKACGDIYNFISGTTEKYPSFKTHFYGTNCTVTTPSVTNVIKGYPEFKDLSGVKMSIFGGCKNGTVNQICNYLGGMPVFDDFFGGVSGTSSTRGVAGTITNTIALDMTENTIPNYIWGGNGYYQIKGVDGATSDAGNSGNEVKGSITCNIYSGYYGTFRCESSAGAFDTCPMTTNVYGGKWASNFMTSNRNYVRGKNTSATPVVVTTNIYAGEFAYAYMGGQNPNDREFVNNIYGGTFNNHYFGGGSVWAKKITNNIYGGTFKASYYGGGGGYSGSTSTYTGCGSEAIVNNIYGGTFSDSNEYMGTYCNPAPSNATSANPISNICDTQTIENNFYGGDFGKNWVYCGHRDGTTGSITNHFFSGEDNPVRDPESPLYAYFDAEGVTTKDTGSYFRDQVVAGGGYTQSRITTNRADSITNTFEGGGFVTGNASTNITIRCGMRWGIAGDVTSHFIKGSYYRVYGGCDYGYVTGTVTNTYGSALEEGEASPELSFSGYVFGGGYDQTNSSTTFGEKIASALKAQSEGKTLSDTQKAWIDMAAEFGEDFEGGAKNIVNHIYYGTFHQFYGGAYGVATSATQNAISHIDSIENNVYGGVFEKLGSESLAYAGGCLRNAVIGKITNNIKGGLYNGNYYGGSVGTGTVECSEIVNVIDDAEGNRESNIQFFMGNGSPAYHGTVTTTINGFRANRAYVFGCSYGEHYQPEGVEYGIFTTINGGEFSGVWGLGGGKSSVYTGNVKTVVNGGKFYGYETTMPNALIGGPRNGTLRGNSELEILGGEFYADVVGGTVWGAQTAACDTIYGNVTTTVKGGKFYDDIYPLARYSEEALKCTGTVTLQGIQTEGKTMYFGGKAPFTAFSAAGTAVELGKKATLSIAALRGKLALKQVEGWMVNDYAFLPAGSEYEILESEDCFGKYAVDDTVKVYGRPITAAGATILLDQRLGARILFPKAEVEGIGADFAAEAMLGDRSLVKATFEDLTEYRGYYSMVVNGIGITDFSTDFAITGQAELVISMEDLVNMGKIAWKNNASWLGLCNALENFHQVYNLGQEGRSAPEAVSGRMSAYRGDLGSEIRSVTASLLMTDAAGVRLDMILWKNPQNLAATVNGKLVSDCAVIEEVVMDGVTCFHAQIDLFFKVGAMEAPFEICIISDAGTYMTYGDSVARLAYQLASDATNPYAENAGALLYYIQKAVRTAL